MAARCLSRPEAAALYLQRAQESELLGQYKDAENLYLEAEEHDLAIKMYRKARLFDNVIQLVTKYQKVDYISLSIFINFQNNVNYFPSTTFSIPSRFLLKPGFHSPPSHPSVTHYGPPNHCGGHQVNQSS